MCCVYTACMYYVRGDFKKYYVFLFVFETLYYCRPSGVRARTHTYLY